MLSQVVSYTVRLILGRTYLTRQLTTHSTHKRKMGRNKKQSSIPSEELLRIPLHSCLVADNATPIVDTHTHLVSTHAAYKSKYKFGKFQTLYEFVSSLYKDRKVESIVDVWCEAPVDKGWREIADSAERKSSDWGGLEYWFVMGSFHSCHLVLIN